jgi:hypothetical protein
MKPRGQRLDRSGPRAAHVSLASIALLLCCLALPAGAAQQVALPTGADVLPVAPGEETILYGNKGIETLLPGTVDDAERVSVEIAPDGTPVAVGVRQRLVVHGLGDFRFKVSGPAQDVVALPESEAEPGLRKGAVLWQGFSADEKVLASEMNMFPKEEARRLPLRVSAEATVDGQPAIEGAAGEFRMELVVSNVSAGPVTITSAEGDPAEVGAALDAVASELAKGRRPVPGTNGVPAELTAVRGVRGVLADVAAPFRIAGEISYPSGLEGVKATAGRGAELEHGAARTVRFSGLVGGGDSDTLTISIEGDASDLGRPALDLVARPAPPASSEARPPGGGTWAAALERGDSVKPRSMWDQLMTVSWQVAKLRQYDTYLGNPDPAGPGNTVYRFRLAEPEIAAPPSTGSSLPPSTSPVLVTTALLALLFLAFDGVLLWSLL